MWVPSLHVAERYTGDLAVMLFGYSEDRFIPKSAEAGFNGYYP